MSNVRDLREKPYFVDEEALRLALQRTLHEFNGKVSVVAAIGVLELLKDRLIQIAKEQ